MPPPLTPFASSADPRVRWHSTSGSTFSRGSGMTWSETDSTGKRVTDCYETIRTTDFIEMFCPARHTSIRFYATELKVRQGPTWVVEQTGSWVTQSRSQPASLDYLRNEQAACHAGRPVMLSGMSF